MKLPNWIQHLRPDNSKPTHLGTVLALFFALSVLVLIIDIVGQFKWMQEIEDNFTIFFLFAAFFSIPIAIWRSTVAEQQAITAQSGLFNERYQKGAEMLGSKVLSVRLGGIYALKRLAEEHLVEYHVQITRLFCAFIRHPTVSDDSLFEPTNEIKMRIINHDQNNIRIEFRPDCQEVMAAILGRDDKKIELEKKSKFRIDLRGANLHQLRWDDFDKVNLYGADLSHSNLTHVDFALYWFLHEVRIDLTDVSLINTNLSGADLRFTKGLTQIQLDSACAYPDSPPNLSDLVDAKSGKTLEWRGQPPEDLA